MTTFIFDDSNIHWQTLGDFKHFVYAVLDIDTKHQIADVIFKFEPHKQILLHRHKALNKTLVIQGEHHLYHANGELKEVRLAGAYTSSPAEPEPHRECGGDEGAIVFFSMRGGDTTLYEVLDDDENIIGTLSFQDFAGLFENNQS